MSSLKHGNDAFKPHAGVNVFQFQRLKLRRSDSVVLDEHQVPEFQVSSAISVDLAFMSFGVLHIAIFKAQVHVNLAIGAAGPGISHLPKVFVPAKEDDVRRIKAGLLGPKIRRLVVAWNFALLVFEAGRPQLVFGQPPNFGEQLPGPGYGFFLVIIAKGPIAEHLKECMVAVVSPDIVQVVVFPGHPHALL